MTRCGSLQCGGLCLGPASASWPLLVVTGSLLPLLHSSMKEMLVDMEEIRKLSHGSSSPHLVDSYLASKVADILMDSVYKLSVRNGDVLLSTSSPPVKLGSRCGLHFQLGSSQVSSTSTPRRLDT